MYTKWIFVICTLVFLNGCIESHDDYYKAHINEAELKSHSCNLALSNAKVKGNKAEIKALSDNKECIAALSVFNEHTKNNERFQKEADKKGAIRIEKSNQMQFENAYEAQLTLMKSLPYLKYLAIKKPCKKQRVPTLHIRAKCKAYYDSFEMKKANEITALQKKYKGEALEIFRDKSCTGKNFDQVYCGLAMSAAKNQIKQLEEDYLSNVNKLKVDFNKCQKAYAKLTVQGDRRQAQKLLLSYQCKVVGDSARKLKVYNFNKAIL